ncbi:MAG: DUF2911 domain-containing protein [Gemmatimonadota bacterium]
MRTVKLFTLSLLALVSPLNAQQRADSAAFIVRLGHDTTLVERHIRTQNQLIVEAVQRSPATVIHRLVLDMTPSNDVARGAYTAIRPGAAANHVERVITVPAGFIPIAGPFYSPYELAVMRGIATGAPRTNVQLLAGTDTVAIPIERVGRDSVALTNQFGEPMRAHVDASGRLLHLHTPAFTSVERVKWIDLDRMSSEFAARDAAGRGLGPLSPRNAYRARAGNANIWVDYSRPRTRGRPIWGALVPYGAVWRMGANEAAHIAVDRTIEIGGVTLAPGTYTLFLLPTASEWSLIINRQTGMSGLERDPAQDVGRVTLTTETLPQPAELFTIRVSGTDGGGRLAVEWDRTRGTVAFTVK